MYTLSKKEEDEGTDLFMMLEWVDSASFLFYDWAGGDEDIFLFIFTP